MAGRTRRIEVRVSERERADLVACSRRAGMSVSEYVRAMAARPNDATTIDVDVAALRKAYADLKHSGSNVNQIARVLNTRGSSAVAAKEIVTTLRAVADAADGISSALAFVRGH